MDPASLAAAVVAFLAPVLAEAKKTAAGELTKAGVGKVLGLLKRRGAPPVQAALGDLEADPASGDNQADLRKRLRALLEQDPALLAELRALLPAAADGGDMRQTVSGDGARGVQIRGNDNKVSM